MWFSIKRLYPFVLNFDDYKHNLKNNMVGLGLVSDKLLNLTMERSVHLLLVISDNIQA